MFFDKIYNIMYGIPGVGFLFGGIVDALTLGGQIKGDIEDETHRKEMKQKGESYYLDRHGVPRDIDGNYPRCTYTYSKMFDKDGRIANALPGIREGDVYVINGWNRKPTKNLSAIKREEELNQRILECKRAGKSAYFLYEIHPYDLIKYPFEERENVIVGEYYRDINTGEIIIRKGLWFYDFKGHIIRKIDGYESSKDAKIIEYHNKYIDSKN